MQMYLCEFKTKCWSSYTIITLFSRIFPPSSFHQGVSSWRQKAKAPPFCVGARYGWQRCFLCIQTCSTSLTAMGRGSLNIVSWAKVPVTDNVCASFHGFQFTGQSSWELTTQTWLPFCWFEVMVWSHTSAKFGQPMTKKSVMLLESF